jgi:hypothetical protein
VLTQIQHTRHDDYNFLCRHVAVFEAGHDSDHKIIQLVRAGEKDVHGATAAFVLPPRPEPPPRDFVEKGYIGLSVVLMPAEGQRRLCTVAHELAPATFWALSPLPARCRGGPRGAKTKKKLIASSPRGIRVSPT